jgi:hypothetical protein
MDICDVAKVELAVFVLFGRLKAATIEHSIRLGIQ